MGYWGSGWVPFGLRSISGGVVSAFSVGQPSRSMRLAMVWQCRPVLADHSLSVNRSP